MGITREYAAQEPTRADIDAMTEPLVLEFGAPWCGYCREMQPWLESALASHPGIRHIKIEDGKGKRLGRTFAIKLWPTLLFIRQGRETQRVVRPHGIAAIRDALAALDNPPGQIQDGASANKAA